MQDIKGKIRNMIFESDSGFKIGLIRVKDTECEELLDLVNKTITFTGSFADLNNEDTYIFYGQYIEHDRYGYQFNVKSYEKIEPQGKDAVVEFLSSSLIKGCGAKTALKIVDALGEDSISKIKENKNNLLLVPGISEASASKIYNSVIKYSETDDLIIYLKNLGFTNNEALKIINYSEEETKDLVNKDLYYYIEIIDFKKLDQIFLKNNATDNEVRVKACIIESMKQLGFTNGDTYFYIEEIYSYLKHNFRIFLEEETFSNYLTELESMDLIYIQEDKYYLMDIYKMERDISENLKEITRNFSPGISDFEEKIKKFEERYKVKYNKDQKKAIKSALNNNITIITGGPGTGKTTIINAIVNLYINEARLDNIGILQNIALLAPTGRASKKMAETTSLPASTIHRYLKWNKDKNEFQINEYNKNHHKLIIVDEVSMIDTYLFDSLLKGIGSNIKLILVGDTNQLPSVSSGMILDDIIKSEVFLHCPLEKIYRQSNNSYIPDLCLEIRNKNVSKDFISQKDDYNFLKVDNRSIKNTIVKICEMSVEKGLDEKDLQILAPMYKGENGIDNLNVGLQSLFNPESKNKKEIKIADVIFREGDKVLQLVNDPDSNVFNGDIGYIVSIEKSSDNKKDIFIINFDGNKVMYKKEDMHMLRHAYAMSIHKSQGSEFNHVIIPITNQYSKMLYNKLIYTGVSRAKKSLVIIGSPEMFLLAVNNEYANNRKTDLKNKIMNIF